IAGPNQTGQASAAAWSHTVITTSGGALSKASAPLLLSPPQGMPAVRSVCSARGLTEPPGRLPALPARPPGGPKWVKTPAERLQRPWVDRATRTAAGADRPHAGRCKVVEDGFREDAAAAVGSAHKQDFHCGSRVFKGGSQAQPQRQRGQGGEQDRQRQQAADL